jgi:hypothetical protein
VYQFSSNWKELATLRLTLDRLPEEDPHSVKGTTVFYFTDNSTVYWIAASGSSASPHLHALIEDIRLLEMKLGCHLQVIHVPGLVMIQQGTDGLSRGIWMTSLQGLEDSRRLTQAVFDPVPYDPDLVTPYLQNLHDWGYPCSNWRYCDWQQTWNPSRGFDRLSVWFPPPKVARQVISFVLETWVEKPITTLALFFIPRTVPAFWRGLSRHLIELDTIFPHLVPLCLPPLLPIPIIVLYLPAHLRSLPTQDRLAFAPLPPGPTGIRNKRHSWAGCHQSLSRNPEKLRCSFRDARFTTAKGIPLRACKTVYHPTCISVGSPFTSRRRHQAGLAFPAIHDWATFICEAYTVRGILKRELTGPNNWQLMALERMRLIDMAHYWATNTHKTYGSKLQILRNFGGTYGFEVLKPTLLVRPSDGPEIPLMWCQEAYGLRPGHSRRKDNSDDLTLAFSTIRSIQSGASQFFAWDMMVSRPHEAYLDDRKRIIQ